jgi:hypothetical protein
MCINLTFIHPSGGNMINFDRCDCGCGEWPEDCLGLVELDREEERLEGCPCCGGFEDYYDGGGYVAWMHRVRPWAFETHPVAIFHYAMTSPDVAAELRAAHGWDEDDLYCRCCCEDHFDGGCLLHDPSVNGYGDLREWEAWAEEQIRRRNNPLIKLSQVEYQVGQPPTLPFDKDLAALAAQLKEEA